uniref:Uncharacterized protein n=2 Tax=Cacopsylla melanoneura TaxID=428564 RepID=A0A8D8R9X6_9HEMI
MCILFERAHYYYLVTKFKQRVSSAMLCSLGRNSVLETQEGNSVLETQEFLFQSHSIINDTILSSGRRSMNRFLSKHIYNNCFINITIVFSFTKKTAFQELGVLFQNIGYQVTDTFVWPLYNSVIIRDGSFKLQALVELTNYSY